MNKLKGGYAIVQFSTTASELYPLIDRAYKLGKIIMISDFVKSGVAFPDLFASVSEDDGDYVLNIPSIAVITVTDESVTVTDPSTPIEYTAGTGINISDEHVISATGGGYTAGEGIAINDSNVIRCTLNRQIELNDGNNFRTLVTRPVGTYRSSYAVTALTGDEKLWAVPTPTLFPEDAVSIGRVDFSGLMGYTAYIIGYVFVSSYQTVADGTYTIYDEKFVARDPFSTKQGVVLNVRAAENVQTQISLQFNETSNASAGAGGTLKDWFVVDIPHPIFFKGELVSGETYAQITKYGQKIEVWPVWQKI